MKTIKLEDGVFLDSSSVVDNRRPLKYVNLDYSFEEQDTGIKWTDGSHIYSKTFEVRLSSSGIRTMVNHNIQNLKSVIKYEGNFKTPGGNNRIMPNVYPSDFALYGLVLYEVTSTQMQFDYGNWAKDSNLSIYVTLFYTKTTN